MHDWEDGRREGGGGGRRGSFQSDEFSALIGRVGEIFDISLMIVTFFPLSIGGEMGEEEEEEGGEYANELPCRVPGGE